jgi:DNA polymerase III epsilon subunit-like protein
METYVYHDTETTGTAGEDRIIETAHLKIKKGVLEEHLEELCNPKTVKIKPAAAMTHGYRNSDIKDKPEFKELKSANSLIEMSSKKDCYYVAHNAPFDLGMLQKEGISWPKERVIDTLRVARHMYMDDEKIEMYKLQYFRYVFENEDGTDAFEHLEKDYMKKLKITHIQPHTALSDILVLWIFHEKLSKDFNLSADDMVALSLTPVLEKTIQFGNIFEKNKPYEEIMNESYFQYGKTKRGYEYLMWAVENMDLSLDREYSLKYYLSKGLINKQISSISQNLKYLNWGMLFSFNEKDIEFALSLQKKESNYVFLNKLIDSYKEKTEESIKKIENTSIEEITQEDITKLTKENFMLDYFEINRKKIIYNIILRYLEFAISNSIYFKSPIIYSVIKEEDTKEEKEEKEKEDAKKFALELKEKVLKNLKTLF